MDWSRIKTSWNSVGHQGMASILEDIPHQCWEGLDSLRLSRGPGMFFLMTHCDISVSCIAGFQNVDKGRCIGVLKYEALPHWSYGIKSFLFPGNNSGYSRQHPHERQSIYSQWETSRAGNSLTIENLLRVPWLPPKLEVWTMQGLCCNIYELMGYGDTGTLQLGHSFIPYFTHLPHHRYVKPTIRVGVVATSRLVQHHCLTKQTDTHTY